METSKNKDDERGRLRRELLSLGFKRWWSKYAKSSDQMRRVMTIFGMNFTANSNLELLLRTRALAILRNRPRISNLNSFRDAVRLLDRSRNVLVVTGAGISVNCGIPDFRSQGGIYSEILSSGEYEFDDPQQMFDIDTFKEDPRIFYSFAHRIYPSTFEPSLCHHFIRCLEDRGKLLRNYTQNIDTLEDKAGVHNVVRCHGSFATASCLKCKRQVACAEIEPAVLSKTVPLCTSCEITVSSSKKVKRAGKSTKKRKPWEDDEDDEEDPSPAHVMKPDIVFFGEKVESDFSRLLDGDRESVDLVVIMGTSMEVKPVSELPAHIPHHVPQILINKTPLRHMDSDVIVLLGDADHIVSHLCGLLGWELPARQSNPKERKVHPDPLKLAGHENIWIYPGAQVGTLEDKSKAPSTPSSNSEAPGTIGRPRRVSKRIRVN